MSDRGSAGRSATDTMRPVKRQTAVIVALLAVAGLLASCGGARHGSARSVLGKTATSGVTDGRMTKTQAIAFARAVNLRAGDVPGFRTSSPKHERETAADKRLERELKRCMGVSSSNHGVAEEIDSPSFERNASVAELSVSSSVSVASSAAAAADELVEFRSVRARACLIRWLRALVEGSYLHGATVGQISVAQGTPPAPGTQGGFGWRFTATIAVRSIRIPFYLDILGFIYGPTEVALFSSGVPVPFPAAAQQRLFLLLLARAKARRV
jgi:hypothetical protein